MSSGAMHGVVQRASAEGERLMISGTPTFFVNGERYSGAIPQQRLHEIVVQAAH